MHYLAVIKNSSYIKLCPHKHRQPDRKWTVWLKFKGYHHLLTGQKISKWSPSSVVLCTSCNFNLCLPSNSIEKTQHQQDEWAMLHQLLLLLRSYKLLDMIASHSVVTWQCESAIFPSVLQQRCLLRAKYVYGVLYYQSKVEKVLSMHPSSIF